ncbi:hypothetical protein chiPu_0020100 [Chiloscyllium punctatum]|uniref:Uncharacterized protein n=1 Tax=Chiloscyllium punctatum TaxID=137246 RepID=A0A401RTZ2_CHIPU|nr:hypothetical protein [Chiloscyllium punctatum]
MRSSGQFAEHAQFWTVCGACAEQILTVGGRSFSRKTVRIETEREGSTIQREKSEVSEILEISYFSSSASDIGRTGFAFRQFTPHVPSGSYRIT